MKICAVICEFNPFHNGHKLLIERAKKLTACDSVLCIMSGNFTQRAEACVFDKFTRAKHAVLNGADCVLELPVPFATSAAEIFAKGAIKILSSIPDVKTLCFGCEKGDAETFLKAAKILLSESEKFKNVLYDGLKSGESYTKCLEKAFVACGGEQNFLNSPNNILGVEYAKAILSCGADIEILPIKRRGAGYSDTELKDGYSSASAIRNSLFNGVNGENRNEKLKNNVPEKVFSDLPFACKCNGFEDILRYALINTDAAELKKTAGCSEGIENLLKRCENLNCEEIISRATSRRYPSSRIKRILLQNALNVTAEDINLCLSNDLYLRPLAVKEQRADEIFSALAKSAYPTVVKFSDRERLNNAGINCLNKDIFADKVYSILSGKEIYPYTVEKI